MVCITPSLPVPRSAERMNKLELIQALKDATDLTKPEAAAVVDIFFNGMADELAEGGRVEDPGIVLVFREGIRWIYRAHSKNW
jgi:hypothetical protein